MFHHILVPTDGSARSRRAAEIAFKLARANHARVTAFHVLPEPAAIAAIDAIPTYPLSPAAYKRKAEAAARRLLERIAARAREVHVPCQTEFKRAADPWKAIVGAARARRCDLIVMGSHARRGIEAVVVGSETRGVLTHSKTPVLVCR
jgi:nucleotide-binding universal stress UspA family protein